MMPVRNNHYNYYNTDIISSFFSLSGLLAVAAVRLELPATQQMPPVGSRRTDGLRFDEWRTSSGSNQDGSSLGRK